MIDFTPFYPEHLNYICPNAEQSEEWLYLKHTGFATMQSGVNLSATHSGILIGAAGIVPSWPGRAEAWAIFSHRIGLRGMRAIIDMMNLVLGDARYRRIDLTVKDGNRSGHTLARACGFVYEAKLEAFHPTGCDMHVYKRIKKP